MTELSTAPTSRTRRRRSRFVAAAVVGGAFTALLVGSGGSAFASGPTSGGSTTGNVDVNTSIALNGLTPSFTLTGIPGATVTGLGAVTMNVQTNNLAGYAVTVESSTPTLLPTAVGNADSIPISALSVEESEFGSFTPVSDTQTVTVHAQDSRSAEAGDNLFNDYQVVIPFVNEDTYSATLNYIATAL